MEIYRQINIATRITFPIVDADGDTVTAATALDSESSTWADGTNPTAFVDVTNEATEIGTTGIYYLILTAAEMNFAYIAVQVKTTSTGAKTQHILINTRFAPLVNASGEVAVSALAAGSVSAAAIATGAIDADALAADAVDEIWDEAMVEQAQGIPGATPAFRTVLAYLYMAFRNAITVTSSTMTFSNDAGTVVAKKALSDDGSVYTEAEAVSGP